MKRAKKEWMKKRVRDRIAQDRELEDEVVAWVAMMNLFDTTVIIPENNSLALRFKEYIDRTYCYYRERNKIVDAIDSRLFEIGYMNFCQVNRGVRPDHVFSPEALAYAILHEHLTPDQIKKVEDLLDHGDTLKTFTMSGAHLSMMVIEQLETSREKPTPHRWPTESCDTECFESH